MQKQGKTAIPKTPIFLSCPVSHQKNQEVFIDNLSSELTNNHLEPITLGKTAYTMHEPLVGISELMAGCYGLICVASKRTYIKNGTYKYHPNVKHSKPKNISDTWLTSPYCQIEPSMALMLGLPILILIEKGVKEEGILEQGTTGLYLPKIDFSNKAYFTSAEWISLFKEWLFRVESTRKAKTKLPKYW